MDVLFFAILSVLCLAAPALMVSVGYLLDRGLPPELSLYLGYSSFRSGRNEETREFADKYMGRVMRLVGLVLLITAAALTAAAASGIIPAEVLSWFLIIELVIATAPILLTEIALIRRYG